MPKHARPVQCRSSGVVMVTLPEIRVLRERDAAAWWQLRLESLECEPFAFGKSAEEHRLMTIEAARRRFRDAPESSLYLGAFDGDALVGTASFIRDEGLKERHKGRIYGVYVSAARRRSGVGRALIAALLERAAQDASLESILLGVSSAAQAAQHLYRSFGFETYGTEPRALKVGTSYVDEENMILRIRSADSTAAPDQQAPHESAPPP